MSQELGKKEKLSTDKSCRKISKACEMHNSVQRTEKGTKILVCIRAGVYKNICNLNTYRSVRVI
jgi:hypothetical protein